ncbi:Regulatory protein RecX protein [Dioscorea alata]|uniref:Regulatory protein RecX protein n=1 Tax=Dioscorea alata TaxID=55571 RepID=A0ACB7W9X4_DIOAL|nr:Regulatory protein RecX protein [Dioscorea alata]
MAIIAVSRSFLISLNSQMLVSCWAKNRHASSGPVRYVPGSYSQEKEGPRPSQLDASVKKDPILMRTRQWMEEKNDLYDSELQQNPCDADCWNVKQSNMCELSVEESCDLNDSTDANLDFMSTDTDESEPILEEEQNADGNLIIKCSEVDYKKTRQDVENLAIELLAGRGLLNDDLYAESFSRSRWLTANWGPRRIKQALVQKGLSETVANKATKQVFEEDDPDMSNQDMLHGMSKPSMDRLFVQASKQWLRGQDTSPEKRKARIIRWLQYRGFSWGVTGFILKKLQSQFPP